MLLRGLRPCLPASLLPFVACVPFLLDETPRDQSLGERQGYHLSEDSTTADESVRID